jgi:hypothetical protein
LGLKIPNSLFFFIKEVLERKKQGEKRMYCGMFYAFRGKRFFPQEQRGKRRTKLRKLLTVLFVLLFAVSLSAQVRTGNIYGKVLDEDGNPLPGVSLTLTGSLTAPLSAVSSATGNFRFSYTGRTYQYDIVGHYFFL